MPVHDRVAYLGVRRGERLAREYAQEVREARLAAGLSQRAVAQAAGVSRPALGRIERGEGRPVDIVTAARIARVVGLDLSLRCFPAAGPLRDEAHVRLIQRFVAELPASVARRLEAPIRLPGDLRAWDVLLIVGGRRIGVAAETRLRDLQALLRRERAKARDDGLDVLLLVVSDTHANRRALRDARAALAADLPLTTRAVLAALRRGAAPTASGIVMI